MALDTLNAASFLELSKRPRARSRGTVFMMSDLIYAVCGLRRAVDLAGSRTAGHYAVAIIWLSMVMAIGRLISA
jgi:hypothetical protein